MSDVDVDVDVERDTEGQYPSGGVRDVYPPSVPVYPWNDPTNGTPLVMHEGEPTPTGEEAIAALRQAQEDFDSGEQRALTEGEGDRRDRRTREGREVEDLG